MQKKIIALAVAGLVSGAAFAQASNVTIYGVADAYLGYSKSGDNKFLGINDGGLSGSRLGFRGEEALGNGLKAIFTLELGASADTGQIAGGNAPLGGLGVMRRSFAGVTGNFGTVTLGRQNAPSADFLGATSSNGVVANNPSNFLIGGFTTMVTGARARWDNSIAFQTVNYSGFDARVVYSFGEQGRPNSKTNDAARFGIGARYENGPVYATLIYQGTSKDRNTVVPGANFYSGENAWAVGGSYDFKVAKLFANYIQEKLKGDSSKLRYWGLGVSAPLSQAGTLMVEYGERKVSDDSNSRSRGFGIGYAHGLSKRTTLYTNLGRMSNKANAASGMFSGQPYFNSDVGGAPTAEAGKSSTSFAVGMRHVF